MVLWWVANAALFLVVAPAVLILLHRVLRPILVIQRRVDEILESGERVTGKLDGLPELLDEVDDKVGHVAIGALRYGDGMGKLLRAAPRSPGGWLAGSGHRSK